MKSAPQNRLSHIKPVRFHAGGPLALAAFVFLAARFLLAVDDTASSGWVNMTEAFTRQIGVHDNMRDYERRCSGMVVVPTGEIFMLTSGMGVCLSTDQGSTWTEVAKYKVLGRRPVHYGNKVFWTTTEGVIVTTNGRDWKLTGKGPENAVFGPYFGTTEQEFMVVSDKSYFLPMTEERRGTPSLRCSSLQRPAGEAISPAVSSVTSGGIPSAISSTHRASEIPSIA